MGIPRKADAGEQVTVKGIDEPVHFLVVTQIPG